MDEIFLIKKIRHVQVSGIKNNLMWILRKTLSFFMTE